MIKRPVLGKTAFFLCDIQEKLIPTIKEASKVISVAQRLLKVSEILNVPVVATEQYPKGLGLTAAELNIFAHNNTKIFEKTQFSMLTSEVRDYLNVLKAESVIIFGLETHVCVYQTVKDLLHNNFNVFLASDGIASRFDEDRSIALKQMRAWNATVSTSESLIFELIQDAKHDKFKDISSIIKSRI